MKLVVCGMKKEHYIRNQRKDEKIEWFLIEEKGWDLLL